MFRRESRQNKQTIFIVRLFHSRLVVGLCVLPRVKQGRTKHPGKREEVYL